jgi:hypothetical protein
MREPSLLDVVKSVVTGARVVRVLLSLAGLYLAYRAIAGLSQSPAVAATVVIAAVLMGLVALAVRQPVRRTETTAILSRVKFPSRPSVGIRPLNLAFAASLIIGLWVAYLAQVQWFDTPQQYWTGIELWVVAAALWLPALYVKPQAEAAALEAAQPRVNWPLAAGGLGVSGIAFWLSGGNLYTQAVVVTWIAGTILWCLALLGYQLAGLPVGLARATAWLQGVWLHGIPLRLFWTALAFFVILALGTYLRFYHLNDVPREMTSDHVEKLLDVSDVLNGKDSIFFIRNTGREPLQFYFVAGLIRTLELPVAHIALKVSTAIAGSLTLIFVFLLARELAGTEVGLLTMFLMAVARWPIAMSRAGLRYPFNPLFVAACFYFLVRGLKSGRRSDFVWAGLAMAAGLHGYSPFRVVPLIVLVIGALWLIRNRLRRDRDGQAGWRLVFNLGASLSVAVLGCVPLLRYTLDQPDQFWFRTLSRIGSVEQPIEGNVFDVLMRNLYRAALMFNYTRDQVWTVNISNWPTLSSLMAALFGLGFIVFVVRMLRGDRWAGLVLVAWSMLLLPSALSLAFPDENPSVVRAGGSAPFVCFMAAWTVATLRREIVKRWPGWGGNVLAGVALITILGGVATTDYHDYFVTFRDQYAQSATNPSEVARQIRAFASAGVDPNHVWLKGYPYWLDLRAVAVESFGNFDWQNAMLDPNQLTAVGTDPLPKLVILNILDRPAIAKLRELYPTGVLAYHTSATPGKDFLTFFVPGTQDFNENTLPASP